MNSSTLKAVSTLCVLLLAVGAAQAQVPQTLAYQGYLQDDTGTPLTTSVTLSFSLWTHPTSTDPNDQAWSEIHPGVSVADGLYTVSLGSLTPFSSQGVDFSSAYWLEISVDEGSGPVVLSPRTPLQAVPYALHALNASGTSGSAWDLAGNGGTVPGTHFLGTTDAVALEIKVNGERAFRIEPTALPDAPNIVGGHASNAAVGGVHGATISGGGYDDGSTVYPNEVTGDYGTVGGGRGNAAGQYASVGGGQLNTSSGQLSTVGGGHNNEADGYIATVGGGHSNTSSGDYSTVAGGQRNSVSADFGTIGGGGSLEAAEGNRVTDNYGTVSGGRGNLAGDAAGTTEDAPFATVGGGWGNTAGKQLSTVGGGVGNEAAGDYATVSGGQDNKAVGTWSTVGGGYDNETSAGSSTISGGVVNRAGVQSAVGGGYNNSALGNSSTISGGSYNETSAIAATIGGGTHHTISAPFGTIAGGGTNIFGQGNLVTDEGGTVGGGGSNQAGDDAGLPDDAWYATVSGGYANIASDDYATVGGGYNNAASRASATVGGGSSNIASGNSSTVGGGNINRVTDDGGTVAGGTNNQAGDAAGTTDNAPYATVSGGNTNTASGYIATVSGGDTNTASGYIATVSGGRTNTAAGKYATVPGGLLNTASGEISFAAGRRARALHNGTFVWGDYTDANIDSDADNQFTARASGGVRFFSNSAATTGVVLNPGSGSWTSASSVQLKTDFEAIDPGAVLAKVASLPISQWRYKAEADGIRHIGTTAEAFYAAFGLGATAAGIASVDADGVAMAAIQGLYRIVEAQQAQIEEQYALIEALQAQQRGRHE